MKKLLILGLVLVLAFAVVGLAACSTDTTEETTATTAAPATTATTAAPATHRDDGCSCDHDVERRGAGTDRHQVRLDHAGD